MDFTNQLIFVSGLLLCLAILAGILSSRTGAPLVLAFLGVGILFGQDGPGGIVFNDMKLSYSVCSVALAVILFDGGIHTRMKNFRAAARPAFLLATAGVLLTAGLTALGMRYLLEAPWLHAMLIGAIMASTDAAAVFLLLRHRGMRLAPGVANTLEVESGINDPMAIFLTLALVQLSLAPDMAPPWLQFAGDFVRQLGIGAAFGFAGGRLLIWFLDRIRLESGHCPIFALAAGLLVFGATSLLGGSGFLAVYVTGLLLGNHEYESKQLVQQFMDGLASLAQLGMLLLLGLLVTPSALVDDIPGAIMVAGLLIFAGRPLAVFVTLAFEPFVWREKLFIAWVGLRGAMPIYLAIFPVMLGLEGHFFNIAFIVVICSLGLQGWTLAPVARLLRVGQPGRG